MGACCSKGIDKVDQRIQIIEYDDFEEEEEKNEIEQGNLGAVVRLGGSSANISMFTQQGSKGINQDAMTVWEDFAGQKHTYFAGVFDGHGRLGHKVACHVRDFLPSKLTSAIQSTRNDASDTNGNVDATINSIIVQNNGDTGKSKQITKDGHKEDGTEDSVVSSWKTSFINSFQEMDDELGAIPSMDPYASGTTAVTLVKQDEHLFVANSGDSRAVICKRGSQNQLVPLQLTNDHKPNIQSEADRIKSRKGRVFALSEEAEVLRVWMPDVYCPGLAMSRAFGDFCLKDYGVISTPEVTYHKITQEDEFLVLATDGIWDALSNEEVITAVASAKKRSTAAKYLVTYAVHTWKTRFPGCKLDDCAVVILFFNDKFLNNGTPEIPPGKSARPIGTPTASFKSTSGGSGRGQKKVGNGGGEVDEDKPVDEVSRLNTLINVPR